MPANRGRERHRFGCAAGLVFGLTAGLSTACSAESSGTTGPTLAVGASLPFTGDESAIGRNLEQALILAAEDVNAAGGVDGKRLAIRSRDSNSGTRRGYADLVALLDTGDIKYLVGPEESELANRVVSDVKRADVFHLLPGYVAPAVNRVSTRGAWMRLAPTAPAVACGLATLAVQQGAQSSSTMTATGDYYTLLASEFSSQFAHLGGKLLPSLMLTPGADSYAQQIAQAFDAGADRTVLIASPATAATVVTEWAVGWRRGAWYLGPTLRTEVFALNIPLGALDGQLGLSPSLSLKSECQVPDGQLHGYIECAQANAESFRRHFAQRWSGDQPFPAAHFYYDAVVLLALGLRYALATQGSLPGAAKLHELILGMTAAGNDIARWNDLGTAMALAGSGTPLRYFGAAAEYQFDEFGAAQHNVFDTWTVAGKSLVGTGTYFATCPRGD